jgi:hypothetical protein
MARETSSQRHQKDTQPENFYEHPPFLQIRPFTQYSIKGSLMEEKMNSSMK